MLYQKVRPKRFEDIIGNKAVVSALQKVVEAKPERRPHAFLFQGQSGCGKTTLARILATELGCKEMSLIELNAANTRGVDSVREVSQSAEMQPMFGDAKVYLFDESHQLTPAAQQALLKVVEDCPVHCYFIFCTTEPDKIIATIRNRCAAHSVLPLRKSEMITLLTKVAESESITISEDITGAIAEAANGSPRQALMLLEEIQDMKDPKDAIEYLRDTVMVTKDSRDLIKEILTYRKNRWEICRDILKRLDSDIESTRLAVLGYLYKVLLDENDSEKVIRIVEMISIFSKNTYSSGKAGLAAMVFEACLY